LWRGSGGVDESDGYRYVAPVDAYPEARSPYGLLGMAGNVWEWVADWFAEDAYRRDHVDDGVVPDPQGPSHGRSRVIRGGSWDYPPIFVRTTTRWMPVRGGQIVDRTIDIGFRCAWDV
jgi:formylglycine-generating enzyme required for sulfatase activity